ncbi:MAG TPA: glutaredoxin family protein [Nocardioidaceae bacterium]|nr:glutaredoxin family protein [Nocardioidaceae bacterium]
MSRVRLLSRAGCHLCDDARQVVTSVCADLGESYDEVDVDADPELTARFGEQVPVVFVDDRLHDFWRIDAVGLRNALAAGHR